MKIKKRNIFRLIWFSLVIIFFIWQWSTYQASNLPENTFSDSDKISVAENSDKLPKNTKMIMIKGGNHSQFGYLGTLLTDENATIDLKEQQDLTLKHLTTFLDLIEN